MTELRNVEADLSRFRARVLVASIVVLVAFMLLVSRLVYLQIFRHEDLAEQAVVVDEKQPAVLAVGGPLTNCVSATHRGQNLALTYRLIGSGGGEYRLRADWRPPQFTIARSGKRIASGKFEFG